MGDFGDEYNLNVSNLNVLETGEDDAELAKINYSGTGPDYAYMAFDDDGSHVKYGYFCISGFSINYKEGEGATKSDDNHCKMFAAGLYDLDDNLVASWDELVNTYHLDIEKDYNYPTYNSETGSYEYKTTSGTYVLNQILGDNQGKLVLPNSVSKIGNNAFIYSTNLAEVKLSNGVTEIGSDAFYRNTNLSKINLTNVITKIGYSAFDTCALTDVPLYSTTEYAYGVFAYNKITQVSLPNWDIIPSIFSGNQITNIDIPASVSSIAGSAFFGNKITNLEIPSNVKIIDSGAFYSNSIETLTLNEGIEEIGYLAFANNNLTSVTLPNSLKHIGGNYNIGNGVRWTGDPLFRDNNNLTSVKFKNMYGWYMVDSRDETKVLEKNVTNSSENATWLKNTAVNGTNYSYYEWYRRDYVEEPVTFAVGSEIYYNVTNGTKCNVLNYLDNLAENNGKATGMKSGCLKFYEISEDTTTVTLLLNHNTTPISYWTSSGTTNNGPGTNDNELLGALNNDTKDWVGTITPANYSERSGTVSYTIDYTGYKARLITDTELRTILGVGDGVKTFEGYNWLVENLRYTGDDDNTYQNSDGSATAQIAGYWTANVCGSDSPYRVSVSNATTRWIGFSGNFGDKTMGVRPVIQVNKSIFE
ncbi:MAG: leucine-rich repeat domain-containing protein [Bacilli bacterium]|nr:leucine-rich repeat domain-containing protein [Bacilli bacterium]